MAKKIKDSDIDKRVGNGVVYITLHEPLPTRFRYAIRFYLELATEFNHTCL